jgi:hypothetical protein
MNIPLNVPMCDLQMTRDSRGDARPQSAEARRPTLCECDCQRVLRSYSSSWKSRLPDATMPAEVSAPRA